MVYRSGGTSERPQNVFKNDGSFLEMFKKLQEVKKEGETSSAPVSTKGEPSSSSEQKPPAPAKPAPFVGKRRGGRVLPTGKVKKPKLVKEEVADGPKDAWSVYLEEVRRYKETTCEEDEKTRPLVK